MNEEGCLMISNASVGNFETKLGMYSLDRELGCIPLTHEVTDE